jgi:mono/diheme cytochrome c family protein
VRRVLIVAFLIGMVTHACSDNAEEGTSPTSAVPVSAPPQTISVATTTTTTQPPTTTATQPPTTTTTQPPTTTTTQPPTTTTAEPPLDGMAMYGQHCGSCHGADLEGGIGPALGPEGHAAHHADEELISIVASGKNGMPAFGDILSHDQINAIIVYMREIQATVHNG